MTLRVQAAFSFLFATLCLAASRVQAQQAVTESRTTTSQDDENSPRLTIRVQVQRIAPLSSWTLVSAEGEAARMLQSTHLRLTWINCPAPTNSASCAIPEQPSDLSLRVLATA